MPRTFAGQWQDQLVECLLAAGTVGKKQTELVLRFKNIVKTAELTNELEAMLGVRKVQKFSVPSPNGKGRQTIVWRATNELTKGWP